MKIFPNHLQVAQQIFYQAPHNIPWYARHCLESGWAHHGWKGYEGSLPWPFGSWLLAKSGLGGYLFSKAFLFFPHGPLFSPTPFFNIPFFKDFSSFFKGSLSLKACAFPKASCVFFNASLWLTRMKFLCPSYFICCCPSYLSNQFVTVQSFDNSWQRDYTTIWLQLWLQSYILDLDAMDASLHYIYKSLFEIRIYTYNFTIAKGFGDIPLWLQKCWYHTAR